MRGLVRHGGDPKIFAAIGGRCLFAVDSRRHGAHRALADDRHLHAALSAVRVAQRRAAVIGALHQLRPLPRLLRAARLRAGRCGRARHRASFGVRESSGRRRSATIIAEIVDFHLCAGLVERRGGPPGVSPMSAPRPTFSPAPGSSVSVRQSAPLFWSGTPTEITTIPAAAAQPSGPNLRRADARSSTMAGEFAGQIRRFTRIRI